MAKSHDAGACEAWARGVETASTLPHAGRPGSAPDARAVRPGLLSCLSEPLESRDAPSRGHRTAAMRLTERDREIIELVGRCTALRARQIQTALFPPGSDSRCQLRLQFLVRARYLDRRPRRLVNEPAIYMLSRRSVEGNRLLRERWGDALFRRQLTRPGPLEHLLALNDVRVLMIRACLDLGWSLSLWQRAEDLALALGREGLVPDAYFQIQRPVDGRAQHQTTAYFVELERSGKSSRVLRSKLERYAELCLSGRYEQLFGVSALRILVVFASEHGSSARHRIRTGLAEAERVGIPIARFAELEQLTARPPAACMTEAVWYRPGDAAPIALLSRQGLQ